MASGQSLQLQANSLHPRLKNLINNDLKEICRSEELPVSGVKAVLQERIIQREIFPPPQPSLCTCESR